MNFKKWLAMVMAVLMLVLLCACARDSAPAENDDEDKDEGTSENGSGNEGSGGEDNEGTGDATSKGDGFQIDETLPAEIQAFLKKVEPLIDLDKYEPSEMLNETSYNMYRDFNQSLNMEIVLDGQTLTLPFDFTVLDAAGWTFNNAEEVIDGGKFFVMSQTVKKDDQRFDATFYNLTEGALPLKECSVGKFSIDSYYGENMDFSFGGGLTLSSTLEEVLDKLGDPWGVHFSFEDDGETGTVLTYMGDDAELKVSFLDDAIYEISLFKI